MGTNPSPQLIPTPASPYHTAGHFGLASGYSRSHSGGLSGPAQPIPIGQLGPPGSFLNPMSVNTNPLGSASLWRPNGNPIGSTTMPLSPDSSEVFTVGVKPLRLRQLDSISEAQPSSKGPNCYNHWHTCLPGWFLALTNRLNGCLYRTWGFSLIEFDTNSGPGFDKIDNDHATSWLLHGSAHRRYYDWKYVVDNRARRTTNSCTSGCGYNFWNLPDTAHVRLFAVILRPIVPFLEVVECVS